MFARNKRATALNLAIRTTLGAEMWLKAGTCDSLPVLKGTAPLATWLVHSENRR